MKAFRAVLVLAVIAAVAVAVYLLTRPSTDAPKADPVACRSAMVKQLHDALTTGATGSRPAACHDISDEELQRIATEILEGGG